MKTPITYYGGKQKLASTIISNIPQHTLYCEPFLGGAAVFFEKPPSLVEVINDTNAEMINFYQVVQTHFVKLKEMVSITLHSRRSFDDASHIYNRPHLFDPTQRAWAVWTLAAQGFAGLLDGSWGYDRAKNTTTKKISNKRDNFTSEYAIRLQNVQIECTDALRIISSRDGNDSFFYCDPPYVGSDCGHYDGYSQKDFDNLLELLSGLKGKFILSSYPNKSLKAFVSKFGWDQIQIKQSVSVANNNSSKGQKSKTEVLSANFPLKRP